MITQTQSTRTRRESASASDGRAATLTPPPSRDVAERAAPAPPPAQRRRRLRPRTRSRLFWLALAAALVLLLGYVFTPSPVAVESAAVVRGPLETTVDAEGVTRVHERYRIAAPISGRLERIALRAGDAVPAGAVVARIMPLPLDAQALLHAESRLNGARALLGEAQTRVEQTREAAEQARRSAARIREVAALGGISVEARERAELALAYAERELEAALARGRAASSEVAAARAALLAVSPAGGRGSAVTVVRAPAAGQVLRVEDVSERVVAAGTPLLEIGDARGLEVVVDVLSTDAVKIRPAATMRLLGWGGEGALLASVLRVEPSGFTKVSALGVEEQRVNVIGALRDRPATLGDGYRLEARIVTWAAADVLKVPVGALFRIGDGWRVFVVENGVARGRTVEIGHRGGSEAEVLDGLSEHEQVIVFPSDRLREGGRVRAP